MSSHILYHSPLSRSMRTNERQNRTGRPCRGGFFLVRAGLCGPLPFGRGTNPATIHPSQHFVQQRWRASFLATTVPTRRFAGVVQWSARQLGQHWHQSMLVLFLLRIVERRRLIVHPASPSSRLSTSLVQALVVVSRFDRRIRCRHDQRHRHVSNVGGGDASETVQFQ